VPLQRVARHGKLYQCAPIAARDDRPQHALDDVEVDRLPDVRVKAGLAAISGIPISRNTISASRASAASRALAARVTQVAEHPMNCSMRASASSTEKLRQQFVTRDYFAREICVSAAAGARVVT
jgi:hypothetical protein